MKKSTKKTFLFSALIVILSTIFMLLLFDVLNNFGKSIAVENAPSMFLDNVELPGIADEDYSIYKLRSVEENADFLKKDNLNAETLTAKDTVVLAAKQVENLTGKSLKGCSFDVTYYDESKLWFIKSFDENGVENYFISANAVLGTLINFNRMNVNEELYRNKGSFTPQEIEECKKRAHEIAAQFFAAGMVDKEQYSAQDTAEKEALGNENKSITIWLELAGRGSLMITFIGEDKEIVDLYYNEYSW